MLHHSLLLSLAAIPALYLIFLTIALLVNRKWNIEQFFSVKAD